MNSSFSLPFKLIHVFLLAACLSLGQAVAGGNEEKVIVIDPGHGGSDFAGTDEEKSKSSPNNATSATKGILEKDVTLLLAKMIAKRIAASPEAASGKVKCLLTRDSDINLDFGKRAALAVKSKASCFVAIHFNGDDNQKASGPRAIIQQISKNPNEAADKAFGLALAKSVELASKKFRPQTPAASVHDDHELHDAWGSYLFHQLNQDSHSRMIPACHLEVEFLDNREIEQLFFVTKKDEVFAAWADAIARELIHQVRPTP